MSSTRYATDGEFHQERYCSTLVQERGLRPSVVIKRCQNLKDPKDRELVWFIQFLSHSAEGLDRLVDFIFDREVAEDLRKRKMSKEDLENYLARFDDDDLVKERILRGLPCKSRIRNSLLEMATNPVLDHLTCILNEHPNLVREYQNQWNDRVGLGFIETEVSRQLFQQLNSVLCSGKLSLIEGPKENVGQTYAAKLWCTQHSGRARYVEVPAAADEADFYRAIAVALGAASGNGRKNVQMRGSSVDALQESKLMLVFDNAHFLWPQSNRRESFPKRLTFILQALVDHSVPVALITTPQFAQEQRLMRKKTGWENATFKSRLTRYWRLPGTLTVKELSAIASLRMPEASSEVLKKVADLAIGTGRFLAFIDTVVSLANFDQKTSNPRKANDRHITAAVAEALNENRLLQEAFADIAPRRQRTIGNEKLRPTLTNNQASAETVNGQDDPAPRIDLFNKLDLD